MEWGQKLREQLGDGEPSVTDRVFTKKAEGTLRRFTESWQILKNKAHALGI